MFPLQILVISLKNSQARKDKVIREMAKTSLEWSFLDAVDGGILDLNSIPYDPKKVKRLLGFELTPKELGCYMSHMKAWQACVEKSIPTLVFEDDFVVENSLETVLGKLLSKNFNSTIIRLQALCDSADITLEDFDSFRVVKNSSDPLGATAYLIYPDSAQKLIHNSIEIYEPVDHFIEHSEKHGLSMLAVKPYPITVVDPTRATSTITDRPDRNSIRGCRKISRSIARIWDRVFSSNPYFPK